MAAMVYSTPDIGVPEQTSLVTSKAVVTNAYTVIPRDALRESVASRLPQWRATRTWILTRPIAGSATTFAQYLVEIDSGGGSDRPEPELGVESFVFILDGKVRLGLDGQSHLLHAGGFAFVPAGSEWNVHNEDRGPAKLIWIRKLYEDSVDALPGAIVGNEQEVSTMIASDTEDRWETNLIPVNDVSYDMHVNVISFRPGVATPFTEAHVMEHGIYVLQGKGVHRLNQDWIEIAQGDYVLLRAFCPHTRYAGGPELFRYLLYKDVNRQVRLTGSSQSRV